MNTEAIEQSIFGMHKGTQGIHLQLRLTACDLKKVEAIRPVPDADFTKLFVWLGPRE